jgi:hypothetical protein
VVVASQDASVVLEFDEVESIAGENEQVDFVPPAAVVAELEVRPGAERGSVGQRLLDGVEALLLMGELRLGDLDPAAVTVELPPYCCVYA